MNKLKLYTGQHPLKNDDFDFLQAATKQGLDACISAFVKKGNGYLVLNGCKPTLNTQLSTASIDVYNVSEGYLVYDNEILFCPNQQVSVPKNAVLQYQIDEQYAASGTRQYGNNNTYECHVVRKVVVEEYNQQGISVNDVLLIQDAISLIIQDSAIVKDITNLVILQNGWSLYSNSNIILHQEAGAKFLSFKFNASTTFNQGASGTSELIAKIPINISPKQEIESPITVRAINHNQRHFGVVKILPNGDIIVEKFYDWGTAPAYIIVNTNFY